MGRADDTDVDPARALAKAYDVVLNGVELGSGSLRNHRSDVHRLTLFHVDCLGDPGIGGGNLHGGLVRLDLHERLILGDAFAGFDQNADDLRLVNSLAKVG